VIRRVPINDLCRIQGKALPVTLLGLGEKISESIGPGSEISYAERSRKRCKVEENAAPPLLQHAFLQGKWLSKLKFYWIIQRRATGFFVSVEHRAKSVEKIESENDVALLSALRSMLLIVFS
jgi:hypothetical protein